MIRLGLTREFYLPKGFHITVTDEAPWLAPGTVVYSMSHHGRPTIPEQVLPSWDDFYDWLRGTERFITKNR